jgi:hypothetical protein
MEAMRTVCALASLAACGHVGFDPTALEDAAGAADVSTGEDAAGPPQFGPWGAPFVIASANSLSLEEGPVLSSDGGELYLASRRLGDGDIYRSVRSGGMFGTLLVIPGLDTTPQQEFEPTLSSDDLTMYIEYANPSPRLYVSTRASTASAWSAPQALEEPEGALAQFRCADFGPGDLRLVVNKNDALYESTRATTSDPWGPPQPLGLTGNCASLRSDGLELYWDDDAVPPSAIYRAERSALDQPFGAAERLSLGAAFDSVGVGDPEVSADGTELVFVAEQTGALMDVFMMTRTLSD